MVHYISKHLKIFYARTINAVQNPSDVIPKFHTLKKKLKAFQAYISQISVSHSTSR